MLKVKAPYYTNSSHLPVGYTADVFEALAVQDELQTLYTSGTVFHAFLGEKLPDWRSAAALVRKIAENFKLPYYTLSPTYSICQKHGYLVGEHATCPHCGEKCEIWSRITGYYRPVQNWNDGKVQEFKDRQEYVIEKSVAPEGKTVSAPEAPKADAKSAAAMEDGLYLFTTKTCPNCGIAKDALDKAGMVYSVMDVSENLKLARSHAIMQAPTLVVYDGGAMQKFVGASAIAGYIGK